MSSNSSAPTSSSDTTKPSSSTPTKTPTTTPTSLLNTLTTFTLLYLTTLFSLDSWAAARASPHRAPGTTVPIRPVAPAPAPDSYQARMHGRGNAGPRDPEDERRRKRDVGVVDSRPAMRMGGTAACGACLS